jgi:hypothetical protein
MTAELVFAPEAELDIAEAYASYERRRAGLGEEFLSASMHVLKASAGNLRCAPWFMRAIAAA